MSEPKFEDRRQYKRIKKHFILNYFDTKNPGHKFSATQLKNISCGGMCLITDQAFTPGTVLGLEIKSPFFANITKIEGTVLQSHESVKNIIYETRLKFLNLSPEASGILKESVEFFTNNENGYE